MRKYIEFIKNDRGEVLVYFKDVRVFRISKADDGRYYIEENGFISFRYVGPTSDTDLDFIKPHKYHTDIESAKEATIEVLNDYINWLTK
jgi:hypothetical protein